MSSVKYALTSVVLSHYIQHKKIKKRVTHSGCGAFHRSDQIVYRHDMLERTQFDWGICDVNLYSSTQLKQQDPHFFMAEKGFQTIAKAIATIKSVYRPVLDANLTKMAEPHVFIESLTMTGKGDCVDHDTHQLVTPYPLIQYNFQHSYSLTSAIATMVETSHLRTYLLNIISLTRYWTIKRLLRCLRKFINSFLIKVHKM